MVDEAVTLWVNHIGPYHNPQVNHNNFGLLDIKFMCKLTHSFGIVIFLGCVGNIRLLSATVLSTRAWD